MKFIILVAFLAAGSFGASVPAGQSKSSEAVIVKYDRNTDVNEYGYALETSDGTKREERGGLLPSQFEKDKDALQVGGSYSFIGTDGVTYTVQYYADETGFHATGAHLPQPPKPIGFR